MDRVLPRALFPAHRDVRMYELYALYNGIVPYRTVYSHSHSLSKLLVDMKLFGT